MEFNIEEEIRCDYLVSKERKKLWAVEIEILKCFDCVCKKYGLKYFLIAGGMLGAVRHRGFIPWDDDIDIGMRRKDYNKLLEVADKEFSYPYFFQDGMNDKEYFDTIIRIRDSKTTGILKKDLYSKCNNGAFIEILPFDNVPNNKYLAAIQNYMILFYKGLLYRRVYHFEAEKSIFKAIIAKCVPLYFRIFTPEITFKKLGDWCSKYENDKTCKYVNILSAYSQKSTFKYEKKFIEEVVWVDFENLKVPIPTAYDACLTSTYKDYMTLPIIEKRGEKHNNIVLYNPFISYKEYLIRLKSRKEINPFINITIGVKEEG